MSKTSDAGNRAAEFLKAWQEQMTRQLHDPDMIRAMLAAMQPFGVQKNDETARKPGTADDAGDDAIRRLERRIDALERQLAGLASVVSLAAKAKNPAGTAKRQRDGAVATRAKPVAANKRGVAKKTKPAVKRAKPAAKPKRK